MKKLFTLFICGLLSVAAAFADEPFRNHRYDSFKVLETNNESIVFIGNSITDMHCWPEAFVTSNGDYLPIVNRGNSGTYSTEQSDNLESYLKGKPKKVFLIVTVTDIFPSPTVISDGTLPETVGIMVTIYICWLHLTLKVTCLFFLY